MAICVIYLFEMIQVKENNTDVFGSDLFTAFMLGCGDLKIIMRFFFKECPGLQPRKGIVNKVPLQDLYLCLQFGYPFLQLLDIVSH